jgi:DNA-3-methyladenine glycosylase II
MTHFVPTHTERVMREAADHLVAVDPAFASVVADSPLCTIGRRDNQPDSHFASLVKSILAQQLSGAVADTLNARLTDSVDGRVTPERVLALDVAQLRSMGLSAAKTRTIQGLATALHAGELDLESSISAGDDHRLRADLTALWGIGRWTTEMFLMFSLHRLDVWPVGDLAMRKGWQLIHDNSGDIDPRLLDTLGDPFTPFRSVTAWYCWRVVDGDNASW